MKRDLSSGYHCYYMATFTSTIVIKCTNSIVYIVFCIYLKIRVVLIFITINVYYKKLSFFAAWLVHLPLFYLSISFVLHLSFLSAVVSVQAPFLSLSNDVAGGIYHYKQQHSPAFHMKKNIYVTVKYCSCSGNPSRGPCSFLQYLFLLFLCFHLFLMIKTPSCSLSGFMVTYHSPAVFFIYDQEYDVLSAIALINSCH